MARKAHKPGKSGTKKYGRNKAKCEMYRARRTRERNKARKLRKYLKKHPNDKSAQEALERYQKLVE